MVALAKRERIYPSRKASSNISIKPMGTICQDNPYLFLFAFQAHVARTLSPPSPPSCGDLWPGEASVPISRDAARCAGHVQQLGSESLLPNLMEVKG